MQTAIENDELNLLFQPKLDLTTGRICGAEALVRWQHPREGRLLPDEFIDGVGPASRASALLDDLASRARALGVKAVTHALKDDPTDAIIGVAESEGADLIVVGNKGMKGVRRMLGSVPNGVAHRAPCSTLIVQTTS